MTTILFFACSHPTILKTKKFAKNFTKMYFQPFDSTPTPENESKVIEIKSMKTGKLTPIYPSVLHRPIFDFRKWKKWRSNTKGK